MKVMVHWQGRPIAHYVTEGSYSRDDAHYSHGARSLCGRAILASTSDPAPAGLHASLSDVPSFVRRCKQCFQEN